jgi:hypothetical protein
MTEQSQGPGWWQASDGKWYPPESAPVAAPTAPLPATPLPAAPPTGGPPATGGPPKGGLGRGPLLGIIGAVIVLIAAVLFFVTKDDKKQNASTTKSTQSSDSATDTSTTKKPKSTTSTTKADPLAIQAPKGFVPFRSDADGFAIALPERMRVFDLTTQTLDQIKAALGSDNPQLSAVFDQAKNLLAQGGKLLAIDAAAAGQGTPVDSINIIRTPGATDPTTKSFSDAIVKQLEGIGATEVAATPLSVPAGKAVQVAFTLAINLPDGSSASIHGKEGVVQAAGALWVITYAAGANASPTEFKGLVDSFVAV